MRLCGNHIMPSAKSIEGVSARSSDILIQVGLTVKSVASSMPVVNYSLWLEFLKNLTLKKNEKGNQL